MNLYPRKKPGVRRHDAALFRGDMSPQTESADMSGSGIESLRKDSLRDSGLPVDMSADSKGSVLLYLIAVMTLFGVLGAGMLALSVSSRESLFSANATNRARFLAESGLRIAQARYCAEGDLATPLTLILLSGEEVLIEKLPDEAGFSALATAFSGTPLEARAKVFGVLPECGAEEPGIPGEAPDDYVVYTGGGGSGSGSGFVLPSSGNIHGSIFGYKVTTSSGVKVSDNVISSTSVTIGSRSEVGGYICAASGDVILLASNTIIAGNIYAFGKVTLESGTQVLGSIFATGDVELSSSGCFVGGDVHAGGQFRVAGGEVGGEVRARLNIEMRNNSKIGGEAHAGNNILFINNQSTIVGHSYAGGSRNDHQPSSIFKLLPERKTPLPPTGCPPAPPPPQKQTFTASTRAADDVPVPQGNSRTIPPGIYRHLDFGGASTVTLQAGNCSAVGQPGCYVFQSFTPARWDQTLRLDLSTGDYIHVFVKGNIEFSGPILVKTNDFGYTNIRNLPIATARALARRVYWETHGTFSITTNNNQRQWLGSVLSQSGISLPSGFFGIGAFATVNGQIDLADGGGTIYFEIADFARNHWLP